MGSDITSVTDRRTDARTDRHRYLDKVLIYTVYTYGVAVIIGLVSILYNSDQLSGLYLFVHIRVHVRMVATGTAIMDTCTSGISIINRLQCTF